MIVSKQPRLRVFFDSSVLIAGTISSRGASYALLRLAELALIDAFISPEVREETVRNVRAKVPAGLPFLSMMLSEAFPKVVEVSDEAIRIALESAHPKVRPPSCNRNERYLTNVIGRKEVKS